MTVASAGMARFAPTDSIKPPRMITTPFGIAGPLTGCTVPPVMAKTPGASAHSGAASRTRATKQMDRLDILTSAAGHHNFVATWQLPAAGSQLATGNWQQFDSTHKTQQPLQHPRSDSTTLPKKS